MGFNFFGGKFHVTNGIRQGGVLSPLLFNVYVNELSNCLNKSGIRGSMNGTVINQMLYADDINVKQGITYVHIGSLFHV